MLFQPRHVPLIRDGTKTVTRRTWAENYPRPTPGAIRMVQYDRDDLDTSPLFMSDEQCDCYIQVLAVDREALGEMTEEDAVKEGGYSLPEFREKWRELHGTFDPEQVVDVIEFEYVGRSRPTQTPDQEDAT